MTRNNLIVNKIRISIRSYIKINRNQSRYLPSYLMELAGRRTGPGCSGIDDLNRMGLEEIMKELYYRFIPSPFISSRLQLITNKPGQARPSDISPTSISGESTSSQRQELWSIEYANRNLPDHMTQQQQDAPERPHGGTRRYSRLHAHPSAYRLYSHTRSQPSKTM